LPTPRHGGSGQAGQSRKAYQSGMTYLFLFITIVAEVIGTMAMAKSDGFTRLGPSLVSFVSYGIAFYLLSLVTRVMPIGIVYAIWSGSGIVLVAAMSWLVFGQKLDLPAVIGVVMIVGGVLIINLLSTSANH
jgi:small multidrug resistance pump